MTFYLGLGEKVAAGGYEEIIEYERQDKGMDVGECGRYKEVIFFKIYHT